MFGFCCRKYLFQEFGGNSVAFRWFRKNRAELVGKCERRFTDHTVGFQTVFFLKFFGDGDRDLSKIAVNFDSKTLRFQKTLPTGDLGAFHSLF